MRAVGSDLGEVVGAEDADCVDDHSEGDHQVDSRCNELTSLEGDATNDDHGLGETLAAERSQERGDDTVRKGGEEASNNASEVERSRENNDVLGVEHFVCKDGEKTDPSNTFDDVSSTMDKYQRRQIARWEQKKAKDQAKLKEQLRLQSYQRNQEIINQAVKAYEPPGDVMFTKARALCSDPRYLSLGAGHTILPLHWDVDNWYTILMSRRIRLFGSPLEVAAEIMEQKREKDQRYVWKMAHTLLCYRARVNLIRDELLVKTTRLRAIQACRYGFKEELMMAAWHPRRLERILETYGWEAYDNLLGVE